MKLTKPVVLLVFPLILAAALLATGEKAATITVKGYVLDSACVFTKGATKPLAEGCAALCAKAGSPLVILTADGVVYWPVSQAPPAIGQNPKLLPFAGQKVAATGKVYRRGGSRAIVIEKIEPLSEERQ